MEQGAAAVLEAFHQPLVIRHYDLPQTLPSGAALVRTEMAGICGTDVHLWKGELPISLPVILGHETVGRLVSLGQGVTQDWSGAPLTAGDRVTWNSALSCGHCVPCTVINQPTRCAARKAYGIGYRCHEPPHFLGGYAEYHYLQPGATIFKIPDDLPTESVVGAGCALITAIHGVERICVENHAGYPAEQPLGSRMPRLPDLWRKHVVVQGTGPVGIAALAVARHAGAERIMAIGAPAHRLAMAKRFGADQVLDIKEVPEASNRVQAVMDWTDGRGADTVLECVGHPSALNEGLAMCRDGGKYLVLGHYCDAGEVPFNPHVVTRKQLQLFGSWSSEPRHLRAALDFLRQTNHEFPFHTMVTHRFSLEQANEALETTARWHSAKSVLLP